MRVSRSVSRVVALVTFCFIAVETGCISKEPEGIAPAKPAKTTVKFDFYHKPLPEIPLPNNLATRFDKSSPTKRRLNASMLAPTELEKRVRRRIDELDGWGVFQPITIPFTGPLDVESILKGHRDADYQLNNDVVYLINVDKKSQKFGEFVALDVGNGNYPVVVEDIQGYWKNDPRGWTLSVMFEETDEDKNKNGRLDEGEDSDADGMLDVPNYLPGKNPAAEDLAGRADALMTFYEKATNTLIVRPMVPLLERTTYAVVVMRRLLDQDGLPVGSPFPYINHEAQTEELAGLKSALSAQGQSVGDVAFAFTFTTQTIQSSWKAVREGLYGHGVQRHIGKDYPAELSGFEVLRDKSFEAFKDITNPYIVYTEDVIDAMSLIATAFLGASEGSTEKEVLLDAYRYIDYQVVTSYVSPQLFERYDENGDYLPLDAQSWPENLTSTPVSVRPETVYVHLVVPRKEVSARGQNKPVPVVLLGHGYTGARFDAAQLGPYIARHGMAVASIDCVSHGISLDQGEVDTASQILGIFGLKPYLDAVTTRGRALDWNNDAKPDSGGDFWTSYLFHTRDVVRQCSLDYMQLARILRSFDGNRTWNFDVNGDGQNELAGDFDADGVVDIGGDAPIYITGGSLGGIMSVVTAAVEPHIKATAPIAGGGGLTDVGNRSLQGGVREAVILRVMGPLFVGTQGPGATEMSLETIIPDVNDDRTVAIGTAAVVKAGDTFVVENLNNGEVGCGVVWKDESDTLRVRASVESDVGDAIQLSFYGGGALVLGSERCELKAGQQPDQTITTFGVDAKFQGILYPRGHKLIALAEGLGLRRANPELRRFLSIGQVVLDAADPAVFAPNLALDPIEYAVGHNGQPEKTGAHALVITTVGDMNVPAGTGVSIGRAAGLIEYKAVDERYGTPANQKLIDTGMVEAVHTLKRYMDPGGEGVHIDVDNFSEGTDPWGTDIPRLDPPLRLGADGVDPLGGKSAAIFPYPRPSGQHGFDFPGAMRDKGVQACLEKCAASGDVAGDGCTCSEQEFFDIGSFVMNVIGQFFRSEGKELSFDLCHSRDDCGDVPPAPAPREIGM
ncbi:MAG: hypothetical protein HUU55_16360 [Myxococcales bacterium]|nr:hypothetical protein [Myxococcales bacterium]